MDITSLESGLAFRGQVTGVRQTYYVFEAKDYFFVLSFARSESKAGSGYFNVVDKKAIRYVGNRFAGESGVTAKDVVARARRTRHAPTSLVALNILYVLVALDEAEIEQVGDHQQLFFSVAKKQRLTSRRTQRG